MIAAGQTKVIGLDDGVQAWIDADTGLMWEVKNEQNITFMYTWRKGSLNKVAESAIAYLEDEITDCQGFIDRMNDAKYAGYDDWRMPSISELETLLYRNGETTRVKEPLSHNVMSGVWSDTPTAALQALKLPPDFWRRTAAIYGIYIIDFRSMSVASYDHEFALWIRAVRGTAV